MSIKTLAQCSFAALLVVLLCLGASSRAVGQRDVSQSSVGKFEMNQADVRVVLHDLFKLVGVSYSIAPEVQGTVTLSLRNVTFQTALENVLRQVDATYRVEGGVFSIIPKQNTSSNVAQIQFDNVDVREAIREAFRTMNVSYTIAPEVQGTVTLNLRDISFDTLLSNILRQANASYRVDGGVYMIFSNEFPPSTFPNHGIRPMEMPSVTTHEDTVVTQDGKFLYIVRGMQTFKVQKSDLKLVRMGSLQGDQGGGRTQKG